MQISVETFEDLKYLSSREAWKLVKQYEEKKISIPIEILLSSQMSSKLIEDPQNIETYVVNGFTIETTDCYKQHYVRIRDIYDKWTCYKNINMWNCNMSWEPEYIRLETILDRVHTTYCLNTHSFELFILQKKNDSI